MLNLYRDFLLNFFRDYLLYLYREYLLNLYRYISFVIPDLVVSGTFSRFQIPDPELFVSDFRIRLK